eukprot:CAMPEP_0172609112 /NCGR_PEP_ID=MMETSP1068-20121228/29143_1 /TAXON_ID=35684 /ORGANISM="Pseudopedinella elastica, Strain CCMP716" /LENGTH=80 /DNA_ID=CAMNT_0013412561 /DNA_START=64 /DNA_END=304 /DNA_ORIENTATION=+
METTSLKPSKMEVGQGRSDEKEHVAEYCSTGGPEETPREYEEDADVAARSRRATERCTRGGKVSESAFMDMPIPSLTTQA